MKEERNEINETDGGGRKLLSEVQNDFQRSVFIYSNTVS